MYGVIILLLVLVFFYLPTTFYFYRLNLNGLQTLFNTCERELEELANAC